MHGLGYKKVAFIVGVDKKSSPKLLLCGRKDFCFTACRGNLEHALDIIIHRHSCKLAVSSVH